MKRDPLVGWHVLFAGALLGSLAVFVINVLEEPLGLVPAILVVAAAAAGLGWYLGRRGR